MRRENFLENVWLGGIEGKMIVRPRFFLLDPPKSFLPKILLLMTKMLMCKLHMGLYVALFIFIFNSNCNKCFFFNFFFITKCCLFLILFNSSFFFFFNLFFRHFFFQIWFLFFNKFWWLYFFGCLSHFCFNWAPYFNRGVYE